MKALLVFGAVCWVTILRQSDHAAQHGVSGKYILVVEDEFLVRLMVVDALRDEGFNVLEAASADEAVDVFRSGIHVDLVFTDVRMPGTIDGLGLVAFVQNAYPEVPVLVTSGHLPSLPAPSTNRVQFLPKPYRMDQVVHLIESSLAQL